MPSSSFDNSAIDTDLLRKKAFNLRWATLPKDVIPLTAADPDFKISPAIQDAIIGYTKEGYFSYGPAEGLPEFREAVAEHLINHRQINTNESLIFPTNSAAFGMYLTARYCLKQGDEAILFDPVDFLFQKSIEHAGGVPVRFSITTQQEEIDFERLEQLITPKTRMLCICNPINPIGRVFTKEELQQFGDIAVRHNLWIMSDEIWSDIIFDPHSFTSIASVSPEVASRTFTIYGFSKTFGIAGLRVGFVNLPNQEVYQQFFDMSDVTSTAFGCSTLSQVAAVSALKEGWPYAQEFIRHLHTVRQTGAQLLNDLPGVSCTPPQGSYLFFANIEETGMNEEALCERLMQEGRVAVVPGAPKWFGPGAKGHIRICFATSIEMLTEGIGRMRSVLEKL